MVYGEDSGNIQRCVCDPSATFIVDGILHGRGEHSSAIIDGVICGELDIGDEDFEVIHVWKMNPSIKANRKQRKEEVYKVLERTKKLLQVRGDAEGVLSAPTVLEWLDDAVSPGEQAFRFSEISHRKVRSSVLSGPPKRTKSRTFMLRFRLNG